MSELEEFSLKDFKKGDKVKLTALRESERKFKAFDKDTGKMSKETSKAHVVVAKGLVNDEEYLIPFTQGTAMYDQIIDMLAEEGINIPADDLSIELTVELKKSGSSRYMYPSFVELGGKDYSSLF